MGEQIDARRRGEDAAKAKGFKSQQQQQQAGMEKQRGGRDILRDQWVSQMHQRYGGLQDSEGNQMPRAVFEEMYDTASQGGKLTHRETVMNAAGGLKDLKVHGGKGVRYESPQQHAAKVRSNQMDRARRLGIPLEDVQISDGYAGAKTPFDIARMGMAAESLRPGRGHGNVAVAIGVEDTNAQAVQGLGDGKQSVMDRMADDQRRNVAARPIGERAQAYRDQHKAMQGGQPANPEAENMHLIQAGASDASGAASNIISGAGTDGDEAFLREWTLAFISKESTGSSGFQKWASRLGIAQTEEAMALWSKLTNTSGRTVYQWLGESFGFNPVPSVKDKKGEPAKKPAPAKKPHQVSPRAPAPRRPFKDE
jgi:hypothetical protein